MTPPGTVGTLGLSDGRRVDYWEGGVAGGPVVLLQPGLPSSRLMALHLHAAATETGTRLLAVSRPGYGGSTVTDDPHLGAVAEDSLQVLDQLGVGSFAALGISGGGPFAVATAVRAPQRVRALGLVAASAPWLDVPALAATDTADGRAFTLARSGDIAAAREVFEQDAREAFGPMLAKDDVAMVRTLMSLSPDAARGPSGPEFERYFALDLREALRTYDGYVHDVLAWSRFEEIDPSAVTVPTFLWYGDADSHVPVGNGRWLETQIPGAVLTELPGEGHAEVSFPHSAEVLQRLS